MVPKLCSKYILSFGNEDYLSFLGGLPKVLSAHQKLFNSRNISYIYLCRAKLHRRLPLGKKYWIVIADGNRLGIFSTNHILAMLSAAEKEGSFLSEIHIHHLGCINLSELDKILECSNAPVKFFIHDYLTVCPIHANLLRNGKDYCGPELISESKCTGCSYYPSAKIEIKPIHAFFTKWAERISFIAPSDFAGDIWSKSYPEFKSRLQIIPHQKASGIYTQNTSPISENTPIKIAFVGAQTENKGWNIWKNSMKSADPAQIKFFYCGKSKNQEENVAYIPVDYRNDPNAMIKALRSEEIHCTVLWSKVPESYSYTYFECLASNTFIITNQLSGNICQQVLKRKNGIVLQNEMDLRKLFSNPSQLRNMINVFRTSGNFGPSELIDVLPAIEDQPSSIQFAGKTNRLEDFLGKIYLAIYLLFT